MTLICFFEEYVYVEYPEHFIIYFPLYSLSYYLQRGECGTSGASGPSSPRCSADVLKKVFDSDGCKQDQRVGLTDNDGLSKIEQLIKGKTFSKYVYTLIILSSFDWIGRDMCLMYVIFETSEFKAQ